MARRTFNRSSVLEKSIGFSRAVRIGSIIAVSGTAPIAPDGTTTGLDDLHRQTLTCLQLSIEAVEELGGTITDILRTRIMLTDVSRWKEAAAAHGEFFAGVQPACTFVEVKGFIRSEWLVETEVDAIVL